jgi:hypothetical protein
MSELGELVAVVFGEDEKWVCPFEHEPVKHDKKNEIPPPSTVNNASKLSSALNEDSKHVETLPIRFEVLGKLREKEEAQFTAHHLIPGNESWPAAKTQLFKWVDKRKRHIKGDIGYNVNASANGVDLPGHTRAKAWGNPAYQNSYAFACMEVDKFRQFHDRHPAYSDFVVNVLNKIAAKLDAQPQPGCGKKDCGGGDKKPPYDPPYELKERLRAVAERLEGMLIGSWRNWRKPVMTSRFALMYKEDLTQDEARDQLRTHKFNYEG